MRLPLSMRPAVAVLLAGLAFTPSAVLAQQAAPAAPVQTLTAAHVAAAREVVVASGLAKSFEVLVPAASEELKYRILTTRPEIGKDLAEVLTALQAEFVVYRDEMLTTAAKIYAFNMTEAELKDVAAFFKTATGQKYVTVQPRISEDLAGQIMLANRQISEQMVGRIRAELKKRNIDL